MGRERMGRWGEGSDGRERNGGKGDERDERGVRENEGGSEEE